MKHLLNIIIMLIILLIPLRFCIWFSLEFFNFDTIDKGELEREYASPYDTNKIECYYLKNEYDPSIGAITYTVTLIYDDRVIYYGYDGAGFDVKWISKDRISVTYYDPENDKYKTIFLDVNNDVFNEWDMREFTKICNTIFIGIGMVLLFAVIALKVRQKNKSTG